MPQITLYPALAGSNSQFVEVPNAGFIFGDQFESGTFDAWTSSFGSPSVVSTFFHSGIYSMQFNHLSGERKTITGQNLVYMRAYFYCSSLSGTGVQSIMSLGGVGAAVQTNAEITYSSGSYYFSMKDYTGASQVSSTVVSTNTWYCIEVAFSKSASGFSKMWVNGSLLESTAGNSSSITQVVYCNVGNYGVDTGLAITGYIDDVVISTSQVGIENRAALVDSLSSTTALQVAGNTALIQDEQETETMQTTAQNTGVISSVEVHMKALASGATDKAETLMVTQSTVYQGASQSIAQGTLLKSGGASDTTGFSDYSDTYKINPYTGVAWTWSDINQLQAGAQPTQSGTSDAMQFSQFYIVVNYTVYFTITASSDANSTIAPSGAVQVAQGNDQAFTFSANVGYVIYQLLGRWCFCTASFALHLH